ncbi:response regulator [Lysobacter sp. A3-1-A15]|uniref:response regulator n=1 Tax=Novilysobacter viscosus TaxID=3098602 RepID=UPI002ED95860
MNKLATLIVEDDEPKLRAIVKFFEEEFPSFPLLLARSLTSAVDVVMRNPIELAVIDMSLPTYDLSHDSAGGGTPQGFGGSDILRFMHSEVGRVNTIVLTQYEEFPSDGVGGCRSLDDLRVELTRDLGSDFHGIIYYSGLHGEWRTKLKALIDSLQAGTR